MKHVLLLVLLASGCAHIWAQNSSVDGQRTNDAKIRRANGRASAADRKAQEALDAIDELRKNDEQRTADSERREQAREKAKLDGIVDSAQITQENNRIDYLKRIQTDAVNRTAPNSSVPATEQVTTPSNAPVFAEPIASITLSNGRVLYEVYLKSFATKSVLVKHREGAETIPYELFPSEYGTFFSAKRPRARSDAEIHADAVRNNSANASVSSQNSAAHLQQLRADARAKNAAAQSSEIATITLLSRHTAAAKSRAEKYFKYEYVYGAGPSRVEIETDEPEEISGWSGKCRVKGTAYLAFHEGRRSIAFEVETETTGRSVKATSITVR